MLSPYVLIMLGAALICLFIAAYVWPQRRNNSETIPLVLLLLAITEWIAAVLLGLLDQNLSHNILWARFEYIGVVSVPLALLVFVLRHAGLKQMLSPQRLAALGVIPVVTLLLAWTNDSHGLIWASYRPYLANGLVLSEKTYGPGFWVYWVYSYLLLVTATVFTLRLTLTSRHMFRWQGLLIVLGILMPWAGNLVYVLHIEPIRNLDLTPLAFGLTAILLPLGMFRWQLFDLKPVAQAAVIAGMADGLMILDGRDRIVEVNPAAQAILGYKGSDLLGKPMAQMIAHWRPPGERAQPLQSETIEIKLANGQGERNYELNDSPFYEKPGEPAGRIVFLHDVTRRRRLEQQLRDAERQHAEALLRQSENKYETLYQNMSVGVLYQSADGQVTAVNPAAERILGVTLAQLADPNLTLANFKAVHGDGSDLPPEELPSLVSLQTGQPLRDQLMGVYFPAEGDYHWILVNTLPQFKPGEARPYQVVATFDDVTQLKRAEGTIRQDNAQLTVLNQIGQSLSKLADPTEILERVLTEIGKVLDNRNLFIALFDPASQSITFPVYVVEGERIRGRSRPLADGVTDYVIHHNAPVLVKRDLVETLSQMGIAITGKVSRSFLAVPIPAGDAAGGAIAIQDYARENAYDEHHQELLTTIAAQISIALENARLFGTVQQQLAEQQRAEQALRASEEKFRLLTEQSVTGIYIIQDARMAYVNPSLCRVFGYAADEIIGRLSPADLIHPDDVPAVMRRLGERLAGQVESGNIVYRALKKNGTTIYIEVYGVQLDYQGRPAVMGTLMDVTQRKQAEDKVQQQLRRLSGLRAIDAAISSSFDLQLLLDVVLQQVLSQLEVAAAVILLLNPHEQILTNVASRGFQSNVLHHSQIKLSESYAGRAVLERQTIQIPDLAQAGGQLAEVLRSAQEEFVAYACTPLISKDGIQGVLEVYQRAPLAADAEWVGFFETLAGQTAIAVENAQLFAGLQQSNAELRRAYDATIAGWSRAMDLRDKETEGHTQRVTDLALNLAERMGLTPEELTQMRRGALLHDIGKLGVPDGILLKPGQLSEEDWRLMRLHPVYAFNMLAPIDYLQPALDIPYCHHEKWDGSGYPRGLKGEAIPLPARIFAIVDVWDAITSDRPYRAAWTKAQALAYIREGSGSHFDPRVVEAFLQLIA